MPESPEELYARAVAAAGADGRLPLPDMSDWVHFPWEVVDGALAAKVLDAPLETEHSRTAREGCPVCASLGSDRTIWENDRFFVSRMFRPSGLLIVFLQPKEHLDLTELDDDTAGECGRLQAVLCRVVESLPHVGRVYAMRFGDGAEHMHLWFVARPERLAQVRGSLAVEWEEILPPIPEDVLQADLHEIARQLATHDGTARV